MGKASPGIEKQFEFGVGVKALVDASVDAVVSVALRLGLYI